MCGCSHVGWFIFIIFFYSPVVRISVKRVCVPFPVFVVESTEVLKLGNFFEVLSQFVQLPVLLPVEMGLHEGPDLSNTDTHKTRFSNMWAWSWQWWGREEARHSDSGAGRLPSVHSVDSWGSFVQCHQTLWCSSCCKILRTSPISHPEASPKHRHVSKHIILSAFILSQSQKHQEETCYYSWESHLQLWTALQRITCRLHSYTVVASWVRNKMSSSFSKCILTQTVLCCISSVCYINIYS